MEMELEEEPVVYKLHYPVGSQYSGLIGKGSLLGFADEILNIAKNHKEFRDREATARKDRTVENRDYKRESRAKPIKRETLAMKAMEKYIKKHPGATRGELIVKALDKFNVGVSTSTVGYSLKALVDQGRIRYTGGSTSYRNYFIVEAA